MGSQIKLIIAGTDRTDKIPRDSISITESLNDRRDTMIFNVIDFQATEGQEVLAYDGADVSAQATSGTAILTLTDIFDDVTKFRIGDAIFIAPNTGSEEKRTILSVDTGNKQITVTENLSNTHAVGVFVGKKTFGGIINSTPDANIGSGILIEQQITALDYGYLLNQRNVVDTYQNMYPREVIGRIIYDFTGFDSESNIFTFETSIDQDSQNATADENVGDIAGTEYWHSQSFTAGSTSRIAAVKLKKAGTIGAVIGDLTIEIQGDSAGDPDGVVIATASVTNSDWFAILDNTEYFVPIAFDQTSATVYHIVVKAATQSNDTSFDIKSGTGAGHKTSIDSGSSWVDQSDALFFETHIVGVTSSGVARGVEVDNQDRIQGNFSWSLGATGAGTATYEIATTSVDIAGKDNLRLFLRVDADSIANLTSATVRYGSDSSNYYEWNIDNIDGDVWSWDSFAFSAAAVVGTPVTTAMDFVRFDFVASGTIPSGNIKADIAKCTNGGFTIKNVHRGATKFSDVRFNYKKLNPTLEAISKQTSYFWFVDNDKDIHYFPSNATPAPYSITDASLNYNNLSVDVDIIDVKNVQVILGGESASETTETEISKVDGLEDFWNTQYKPKDLAIFEKRAPSSVFVEMTVGVENLVQDSSVDYVFNFNEKTVRRASASQLADGDEIKFVYNPFKPIRIKYKDSVSIAAIQSLLGGDGVFEGAVISDSGIKTFTEARQRAQAEVDAYKNPIVNVGFSTHVEGLRTGQIINITNSERGISGEYIIQTVSKQQNIDARFFYSISASSTLFGIVEFFQYLLNRSPIKLESSAQIDVTSTIEEEMQIDDEFTMTQRIEAFQMVIELGVNNRDAIVGQCVMLNTTTEQPDTTNIYT